MRAPTKDDEKPLTVWRFLNSSFALWLLSAFFITGAGSIFTQYQSQTAESRKNKEYIEKLDLEISFRFSQFFNRVYQLTDTVNPPKLTGSATGADVRKLVDELRGPNPSTLGFLYPEFRNLGVMALEAELRRLLEGGERDEVDKAISSISNGARLMELDFGDVPTVGSIVNEYMAPRWKQARFAFVDCPSDTPFC